MFLTEASEALIPMEFSNFFESGWPSCLEKALVILLFKCVVEKNVL